MRDVLMVDCIELRRARWVVEMFYLRRAVAGGALALGWTMGLTDLGMARARRIVIAAVDKLQRETYANKAGRRGRRQMPSDKDTAWQLACKQQPRRTLCA